MVRSKEKISFRKLTSSELKNIDLHKLKKDLLENKPKTEIKDSTTNLTAKGHGFVSSVYFWIYSDNFDREQAIKLLGADGGKLTQNGTEIWVGNVGWHRGYDVSYPLEKFLFETVLKFKNLKSLINDDSTTMQLDWVIGIGDHLDDGDLPLLEITTKVAKELSRLKLKLKIYIDSEIDAEQVGFKKS